MGMRGPAVHALPFGLKQMLKVGSRFGAKFLVEEPELR
jgi:hypothetical protein